MYIIFFEQKMGLENESYMASTFSRPHTFWFVAVKESNKRFNVRAQVMNKILNGVLTVICNYSRSQLPYSSANLSYSK